MPANTDAVHKWLFCLLRHEHTERQCQRQLQASSGIFEVLPLGLPLGNGGGGVDFGAS